MKTNRIKKNVKYQKSIRKNKTKPFLTMSKLIFSGLVLVLISLIVGLTLGTNAERNNNMEKYGTEAYNSVLADGQMLWYKNTIKATADNPIDLNLIQIPDHYAVMRVDNELYCVDTYSVEYETKIIFAGNKCSEVAKRTSELNFGELYKTIPMNGTLANNGDDSWNCSAVDINYENTTLNNCVNYLRNQTFIEYNEFIKKNYVNYTDSDLITTNSYQ